MYSAQDGDAASLASLTASISGLPEQDFEYDYYEPAVPGSYLMPTNANAAIGWSAASQIDIDEIIGDSELMKMREKSLLFTCILLVTLITTDEALRTRSVSVSTTTDRMTDVGNLSDRSMQSTHNTIQKQTTTTSTSIFEQVQFIDDHN
jgi:hypothetical protein